MLGPQYTQSGLVTDTDGPIFPPSVPTTVIGARERGERHTGVAVALCHGAPPYERGEEGGKGRRYAGTASWLPAVGREGIHA